ncbi:MAG: hypothetical protein J6386_09820 [Candidatus Synoicihabitans palmerolidicus]|nr:hypothetical protein [Candidatus Synoicihabitans palmerolidicus]
MPYPKLVRLIALGLTASILTTPAFAQAKAETDDEIKAPPGFVLPPRLRQIAFRDAANPWTFHVNAHYNTGDAGVDFGDLGSVPSGRNLPGADQTDVAIREYDDGGVALDGLRTTEVDANGNQTSTPGERYTFEQSEGVFGAALAYTPGRTR